MANFSAPLQVINNPFTFSKQEIRTAVDERGNGWFCAKDVFESLDITWSGSGTTLKNYPEKWKLTLYLTTSFGQKDIIFISEPAVYQTAFRSNKPEAIRFTEWVCEEVLPAIRKSGSYGSLNTGQRIQLRYQKIKLIENLNTTDKFKYEAVLTSLRDVCGELGEMMPDPALLGQDRHQLISSGV